MSISVLEIVLYSAISLIVLIYLTTGIIKLVDRKKHPEKYEKKEQDELDE